MSEKLSSSLEDYLEKIYMIFQTVKTVRAVDVSRALNVSRASTTEALKKLCEKGYINYGRYNAITLTSSGIEKAKEVFSKHNSLYIFFKDVLGVSDSEASINACAIEHIITPDALNSIISFTKNYKSKIKK